MSVTSETGQAGQPSETYVTAIESVEDLEAAEAYAQNNPGTRIVLDYQVPVISRGWGEADVLDEQASDTHVRGLGGATSYEDSNSMGIIQSGGCFEDFQEWLASEASEIVGDVYMGRKDVFLDEGRGRNDRKVIGFGAKMDSIESPNLYGATWREGSLQEETRELIEEDHVPVLPEEVEAYSYNIKEETGQSLSEQLILEEAPEIPEGERELPSRRSGRRPSSCTVDWRPEDEYSVEMEKLDTAVWPWHTS